jgi:CRP-like cAMP-binding protein
VIFLEGEVADAFYIILEGQVQIFSYDEAGDSVVLARHTKGDFFGEKAACPSTNPVRTASARTLKKAILYKIPRKQSNACLGVYKKTLTL